MAPKTPKPELTPEEKKALKAAKKEEKKRLKIEKAKQLQRDYLGRELKYGALTLKRHEKRWRQMLINLALPKMREDLEFAWHNFERVIDCKNFTISLLMDEIKESEEQYMMNIRNHMHNIDKLIDLFQERIEELQADYENEIDLLKKRGEEEVLEIKLTAEEEENYIKTMIHILEVARKLQKQNVRAEYFSKLEEEDNKSNHIVNMLKVVLDNKFHIIMKDTDRFLTRYAKNTKERRKEHDELKTQDDELQQLMLEQLEKIRKDCEYIKVLKVRLTDSQKIMGRKLRDIQDENNFFEVVFSTLKKRLVVDNETDLQKMIALTVSYNETVEHLDKLKEKAESILHMSAVCRKLETQKEKVMAFPVEPTDDSPHSEHKEEFPDEFMPQMEMFWQRVAQVDASRFAINEEREYLRTENELLKMKLYQYCQCLSCPAPSRNIIAKGVKHVTEGTLEIQKYEKQFSSKLNQFGSSRQHFDIDY